MLAGSVNRADGLSAGLLAASAGVGADLAVLVHFGVARTFLGAEFAGGRARLDHLAQQILIRPGATGSQTSRHLAYVGAIHVEPDALPELIDHLLGQAGVGARDAGLGAGVTFVDAANEGVVHAAFHVGVVLII